MNHLKKLGRGATHLTPVQEDPSELLRPVKAGKSQYMDHDSGYKDQSKSFGSHNQSSRHSTQFDGYGYSEDSQEQAAARTIRSQMDHKIKKSAKSQLNELENISEKLAQINFGSKAFQTESSPSSDQGRYQHTFYSDKAHNHNYTNEIDTLLELLQKKRSDLDKIHTDTAKTLRNLKSEKFSALKRAQYKLYDVQAKVYDLRKQRDELETMMHLSETDVACTLEQKPESYQYIKRNALEYYRNDSDGAFHDLAPHSNVNFDLDFQKRQVRDLDSEISQLEKENLKCIKDKCKEELLDITKGIIGVADNWNQFKDK